MGIVSVTNINVTGFVGFIQPIQLGPGATLQIDFATTNLTGNFNVGGPNVISAGDPSETLFNAGTMDQVFNLIGSNPDDGVFTFGCNTGAAPPGGGIPGLEQNETATVTIAILDDTKLSNHPENQPGNNDDFFPINIDVPTEFPGLDNPAVRATYNQIQDDTKKLDQARETRALAQGQLAEQDLRESEKRRLAWIVLTESSYIRQLETSIKDSISVFPGGKINYERIAKEEAEKAKSAMGAAGVKFPFATDSSIEELADVSEKLKESSGIEKFKLGPQGFTVADRVSVNGMTFWSRIKLSHIDGAADTSGFSVAGRLGLVTSLSPQTDAGIFLDLFTGQLDMDAIATELDSDAIGAGIYIKHQLSETLRAGVTATFERSQNDITFFGATGSFDRDRFTIDGALTGVYMVDETRVLPSISFQWMRSDRDSYTDSTATFVPGQTDDRTTATAAVNFSRTFISELENAVTWTPNIGFGINYHFNQFDDVVFGNGVEVQFSDVTGDLSAGVTWQLLNGGSFDLNAGINGIGGDFQTYSGTASLTIPLN